VAYNLLSGTVVANEQVVFKPSSNGGAHTNAIVGEFHGDGTYLTNVSRVVSNATPDYVLTVGANADSLVGEPNLQFNGSRLYINGNIEATALKLSSLSAGQATTSSFLALDDNNNVVLTSSAGGPDYAIAQGPINSLQFHASPGDISGSENITFSNDTLNINGALDVTNGVTLGGIVSISSSAPIGVTGSLIPSGSTVFSLGTAANRWESIYVGTGSVHLGPNCTISSTSDGVLVNKTLHVSGNLVVSGNIEAHGFDIIQTNLFEINQSGSTAFGDSNDDTHHFTGSFSILSSSTDVFAVDAENKTTIINTGLTLNRVLVTSNYSVLKSDYYVGINTSSPSAMITASLPNANTLNSGQTFVFKDEGGASNTHNIVIVADSGQTIDNQNKVILESPYSSLTVYTDGASKFFIT
tara:strand:- start:1123 stop:2358 length:1236 start_codon:yes stop_codon:yes gene_type:complete